MARTITHCPCCKAKLIISEVSPANTGDYQQPPRGRSAVATLQSTQRLRSDAAAIAPAPPGDWQKVTPVARLTTADVTTSIYDAGVSFGLVTVGGLGICWWFSWPLVIAPASGFAVALWRYFGGIGLAKSLLEIVETATQRDIDGDGKVGPESEPTKPQTVRAEIKTDSSQWRFVEFDIEPQKLHDLAALILTNHGFTERTALKAELTQDQFRALRDKLIAEGLAKWNHPTRRQNGASLHRGGRILFRAILDTPLPRDQDSPENIDQDRTQHAAAGK